MANKIQAKAAIDSAVTSIKADIDNILPTGVNIKDGSIGFAPLVYSITLDAGGVPATALSWFNSITAALTTAGRTYTTIGLLRRSSDTVKGYNISEAKLNVSIINF